MGIIKIGNIQLDDWSVDIENTMYRESTIRPKDDFVGFVCSEVEYGMDGRHKYDGRLVWHPIFGMGGVAFLRKLYYDQFAGMAKFSLADAQQAMDHMDKFLIRMSGLIALI